ncbi:metallophosphoesterase [bacterium]|nr:metallophosphoesterase [bacterium]
MLQLFTFLLVVAALGHVWLQGFNRYLITIRDTPRKTLWFKVWGVAIVGIPTALLIAFWRTETVQSALSWHPTVPASHWLFGGFGIVWLYGLWRLGRWTTDRIAPPASRHHIEDRTTMPSIPHAPTKLPFYLRPIETTFDLEVIDREIEVPCLAPAFDGLTIVQVSDVHYEPRFGRDAYFDAVAQQANLLHGDVVVFTGDFISMQRFIPAAVEFHARIRGQLATLCVMGNHDYWTRPDRVREHCARHAIRWMHNRRWTLERNGRRLIFAGTDAPWGKTRSDWRELVRRGTGEAVILLSHTPDNAPGAARNGANLVLSGHNHGGQLAFPLIGPIVVPSRYGLKYTCGVYDIGDDCVLNVSRGIGVSDANGGGRTMAPPQLIRLTLRSPHADVMAGVTERAAVAAAVRTLPS